MMKCFFTQVCDIIDGLFVSIFKHLTENCKKELETINRQYPFEPLQVKQSCLFYCLTVQLSRLCSSID
jgi:aspartyl-tRNA synthetase